MGDFEYYTTWAALLETVGYALILFIGLQKGTGHWRAVWCICISMFTVQTSLAVLLTTVIIPLIDVTIITKLVENFGDGSSTWAEAVAKISLGNAILHFVPVAVATTAAARIWPTEKEWGSIFAQTNLVALYVFFSGVAYLIPMSVYMLCVGYGDRYGIQTDTLDLAATVVSGGSVVALWFVMCVALAHSPHKKKANE